MKKKILFAGALAAVAGVVGALLLAGSHHAPPDVTPKRAVAIQPTLDGLREECRLAAGGDWDLWLQQMQPYREALRQRVRSAGREHPDRAFEARYPALGALDDFPLVEPAPRFTSNTCSIRSCWNRSGWPGQCKRWPNG